MEGEQPDITISWGDPEPGVTINGHTFNDRAAVNRMIRALRRARDRTFGRDY